MGFASMTAPESHGASALADVSTPPQFLNPGAPPCRTAAKAWDELSQIAETTDPLPEQQRVTRFMHAENARLGALQA